MATLATMRATTDIEEMDRELFEARKNFATMFQASPAIHCIIQLNGLRYCEINRAYEQCTGFSRSEVLGKVSLRLGLWSNAEDRDQMFRKLVVHGRVPRHQAVFQTKGANPLLHFCRLRSYSTTAGPAHWWLPRTLPSANRRKKRGCFWPNA